MVVALTVGCSNYINTCHLKHIVSIMNAPQFILSQFLFYCIAHCSCQKIKHIKYSNSVVLQLSLCPQVATNTVYYSSFPEDGLLSHAATCRRANQQINNIVQQVNMNPLCTFTSSNAVQSLLKLKQHIPIGSSHLVHIFYKLCSTLLKFW